MRRLAFAVKINATQWVVIAVPRLRDQDAVCLATFGNYGDANWYANQLNSIARTFMPPTKKRKG